MDEATAKAFTVIGAINDTAWGTDFAMTEESEGVWVSNDTFHMAAGTQFKCRQGLSWDVNFGGDGPDGNFEVKEEGDYKVKLTFDGQNGTIELIAP